MLGAFGPADASVFAVNDDGILTTISDVDGPATVAPSAPLGALAAETALMTIPLPPTVPQSFAAATSAAAAANGVSAELLAAVVWQESRWRVTDVSRAGAVGLAQLMPATAGGMGVDPRDPIASLYGAAHYLRAQIDRFRGNVELALAAYNAGPARVSRAGGVPPLDETRKYVNAIMDRLAVVSIKGN